MRRVAQLTSRAAMDWCVAYQSADARARMVEICDFLVYHDPHVLRALSEAEGRASGACAGDFLVQRAGTDQYALLPVSLLAELSGPRVKSRPPRLNFFDVLRASLGDPQFVDVCLVPEAPYFHERALHSCNSDSAPSTILNSVRMSAAAFGPCEAGCQAQGHSPHDETEAVATAMPRLVWEVGPEGTPSG